MVVQESHNACHKGSKPRGGCGWWLIPVIPAFGRLRQEHCDLEDNLCYIVLSQPGLHSKSLSQTYIQSKTNSPKTRQKKKGKKEGGRKAGMEVV